MSDFAKLVLDADTKGLKRGEQHLKDIGRQSGRTASEIDKAAGAISGRLGGMAKSFAATAVAALGIGGAIGSLISVNASFGASMQKVAAISGATADELDKLRETAKLMGSQTEFSASQAADALGFLAMAGFSATESIEAIPSVLALATASSMDLATAADIASNVLSGFGKAAGDASQVADVLAKAASSTNTSVGQLGEAMSTAAPIANALGISMEEAAAAIGVMSDAGIQGSRAGTALRGVFASLAGPTNQAQEALAKYGLTAKDIDPQTVGLANAMDKLRTAGLSTADAMVIFGREAASGALVMAETSERIRELTGDFENAEGAASDMARIMSDNLTGDINSFKSALEGLIITLGDSGITGGFRQFVQTGTAALRAVGDNMGLLTGIAAGAATAFLSYRTATLAASLATTAFASNLRLFSGIVASTATQVGVLSAAKVAASGITAGLSVAVRGLTAALIPNPFAAVAVAVGTLTTAMFSLADAQRQAKAETDNLITSLQALAQARSADFASRRAEVDMQLSGARDELIRLELERDRLRRTGGTGTGFGLNAGSSNIRRINQELTEQARTVLGLENALFKADKAFEQAEKAAESIVVPAAKAASAISDISSAGGKASTASRKVSETIQDLTERYFPEFINRTKSAQLELVRLAESAGELSKEFALSLRLRIIGADPGKISDELQNSMRNAGTGALEDMRVRSQEIPVLYDRMLDINGKFVDKTKEQNKSLGDSFGMMADRALGALDRLANGIRGGGFLDILGGILGLGMSLGGMGLFGSKIAENINSFGGARANGGPVSSGKSYLVGERGPELFTPGASGAITPNHAMGQRVHVTVGIDPANGNITAFVDGQIAASTPAIMQGASQVTQAQMARQARRRA